MDKKIKPAKTVDEYIKKFPSEVQVVLQKLRKTIKAAAAGSEEMISYMMPAYKYKGVLVYFGAYKTHIGFYPTAGGITAFIKELSGYEVSKGTIRFPVNTPLPFDLISKIVKFRMKENEEKFAIKNKKAIRSAEPEKRSTKPTDEELVKAYMDKLEPTAKKEINAVRKIIKSSSPKLHERIKWNAPSYYYKEDLVTFGPYKTHQLLLVFHHPSVVKIQSPLLQGDYKNRRLVYLENMKAIKDNKKELERIIEELVKAIDKK